MPLPSLWPCPTPAETPLPLCHEVSPHLAYVPASARKCLLLPSKFSGQLYWLPAGICAESPCHPSLQLRYHLTPPPCLCLQLTVNIVAVVTACVGALAVQESPLTAVQMLWVNLIMDSLASLALATDSPTEAMLDLPPYSAQQSLLTPTVSQRLSCTQWVGPRGACMSCPHSSIR